MDESGAFDTFAWAVGRLAVNAALVDRGVRPVAEEMVRKEHARALLADPLVVHSLADLQHHTVSRGEHHVAIYFYKHPHLLEVIKHLADEESDATVFGQWVHGKMYGYSETEIDAFIREKAAE